MTVWRTYVAVGSVVISAYLLIPTGLVRDAVYLVVGLTSVVAICVGLRLNRPAARIPWYLFAAGQMAWIVGDTIYIWNLDVRHVVPFPSIADIAYLGAYPLLAAGVGMLIRLRRTGLDIPGAIDSAIVFVGLGLLSWAWIARPLWAAADVPAFERAVAVAYPVCDIILMALLVRLVTTTRAPSAAFRLLVGAVILQVIADTAMAAAPSSTWDYSGELDLLWLGSYLLWGAAALHPDMKFLSRRLEPGPGPFTARRMAALGAAALLPPATFLVGLMMGHPIDAWAVVGGAIILPSLVLARMACAIGEIRLTSSQRDRLQDELFHRSAHDPLTGLYNRVYMLKLIEASLARGQWSGTATGLVLVDLDQFNALDDDWGPETGDAVLRETARRIRSAVNPLHPVGRLGDDQFIALIEARDAVEQTPLVARQLLTVLRRPHQQDGYGISVTPNIGLAVSLDAGTQASELLREAQTANRRAKAGANGSFEVFDKHMRREVTQRAEIETALRQALRDGALELFYQPVVAVTTEVIDGYEALVRWNDVDGTVRMPMDFIPIAEKSELICEVGRWVLSEATRQFARWITLDPDRFADLTIAVNISGRHLADHRIVDDVSAALAESGLDAHHLAIEVTETVLVDVPHAVISLGALRDLGVTISLDDFGTGYTSISQLRYLPIDTVKIDKSFLDATDPGSSELIALMTAAAHACGMSVVAEGVERREQLEQLRDLACDSAQGYLFAHPLSSDAVISGREVDPPLRLHLVRDP